MGNKQIRILIADDDADDLELIEEAIRNSAPAAELHKLTEGKAVLHFLNEQPDDKLPCLIIIDYNMPEMNGAQLLEQLKHKPRYKDIPKVMLSTSGAALYKTECKNKGALDYFVKPNTLKELDTVAKKMLKYCEV